MGAHLAALLNSEYASGLGTAALLTQDVTDTPLIPVGGEIAVGRIQVIEEKIAGLGLDPVKSSWWMERLDRSLRP
jgi:O-succinylbenzoate synthase